MKTIFRFLAVGILMTVFSAVTVTSSYAQDVCAEVAPKQALDKEFRDNYDKVQDSAKQEIAVKAGKQYIEKYGACAADKDFVQYLKDNLPGIEKGIADAKIANENKAKADAMKALFVRFDTAVKGTGGKANPADTYAVGKEILAQSPDLVDVVLVLGSVGFDQATLPTPVDTYNNDTIEYAKMAIQKLEANTPSKNYGVFQYAYKNKDYPDGKSNALGWMNYNIGYIMYFRQGKDNPAKKKEALPYLYKATQFNSSNKSNPAVYQAIGAWYLDEALRIDKERAALVKAAGDKDTEETLAMVGLQKGYADRSIDAYARAYKLAKDDKSQKKEYVDGLYTRLKELYAFRYDGKTTGIDEFVATVQSKPLPDPTTAITPVKEEPTTPAPTTSTTTPAPNTSKPATSAPTPNTTKPATTTKPPSMTTPNAEASEAVGATSAKTDKTKAKKPTPKKKGTR